MSERRAGQSVIPELLKSLIPITPMGRAMLIGIAVWFADWTFTTERTLFGSRAAKTLFDVASALALIKYALPQTRLILLIPTSPPLSDTSLNWLPIFTLMVPTFLETLRAAASTALRTSLEPLLRVRNWKTMKSKMMRKPAEIATKTMETPPCPRTLRDFCSD